MIDTQPRTRRLAYEILGMFVICFVISVLLYFFLSFCYVELIEEYCYMNNVPLNSDQLYHLDNMAYAASIAISVGFFVILFLILFGERISYIRAIINGVDSLRKGDLNSRVAISGNNELTRLAEAVNYLSDSEKQIKAREQKIAAEKEALIRSLSHDIRTPLTSVISYAELLCEKNFTVEERQEYLSLILKKSNQIKELTEILLDGGKRQVEFFENAHLLMEQLAEEFAEVLEDDFPVSVDLSGLSPFSGNFDVKELQRIFDNLTSNIQKYADKNSTVLLAFFSAENGLVITQKNAVRAKQTSTESYQVGLNSIRRIAQNYEGTVKIDLTDAEFSIAIILSKI